MTVGRETASANSVFYFPWIVLFFFPLFDGLLSFAPSPRPLPWQVFFQSLLREERIKESIWPRG